MSSREEFEAWVVTHHVGSSLEGDIWDDFDYPELVGQFIYDEFDVQNSWASWQASRQALVVELPAKISHLPHSQVADGFVLPEAEQYDEAIDDCREAIEAAGVRVKT